MSKICGECRHFDNDCQGVSKSTPASYCEDFERKPTVFQQITASPEVLAEMLVFTSYFEDCHYKARAWKSVFFLPNRYRTKEEAISATVAKLKEVVE